MVHSAQNSSLSSKHQFVIAAVLIAFGFTTDALAASGADIGTLSDNVVGTLTGVVKLITAISYVAGMGFALAGIIKFKSHRDNPTNVPLSQPIVMIVIAAALLFLPSILQSAGATIFGTGNGQAGQVGGFTDISQ